MDTRAIYRLTPYFLSLWSLGAEAAFVLPHAGSPEERAALAARWTAEAPWLAKSYAAQIPGMLNGTAQLVPKLENDPTWQKLAAERPDPVTLYVDVTRVEQRPVRAIKREVADRWRKEVAEAIAALEVEGEREQPGSPSDTLEKKAASELAWLSAHDARALITGAINCLPGPSRGAYFKMTSPEEQLKALQANPDFNDTALKGGFRGDAFGLTGEVISRQSVEAMIAESIRRDGQLVTLLRSLWYARSATRDTDAGLDPFDAPVEQSKDFFENLASPNKRAAPYLQRLTKSQINEANYEERMDDITVVAKTFKVQEVSPEMGATRGYLMEDCSMGAYAFAYTPQEFIYLVSNEKGDPVGFISATSVMGNGRKTLFVHDFAGRQVTVEIVNHVLEALNKAIPQMGFAQMTVSTFNALGTEGAYSAAMDKRVSQAKTRVPQQYLDAEMRPVILKGFGNDYDLVTNPNNLNPPLFEPSPQIAQATQVRVEHEGTGALVGRPNSKPEAILRALEMFSVNPEGGLTAAMLQLEGVQAADLRALVYALKNPRALPLEQYYEGLRESFAGFDIGMSGKFVRDHDYLFWEGHLKASDNTTSLDGSLTNRTAEYVILSMKRIPEPAAALEVLARDKGFFDRSEKFQTYLRGFSGRGQGEGPQIEKLMALGFSFDYLRQDNGALLRLADGRSASVRRWAALGLRPEQLKDLKPETVRGLAADLAADSDELPRTASSLLLHTNNHDPEVIRELKLSVKEDKDEVVATRAALALIEVGDFGAGSVRKVLRNLKNPAIEPETRARAAAVIQALKEAKDRRYCDSLLEGPSG